MFSLKFSFLLVFAAVQGHLALDNWQLYSTETGFHYIYIYIYSIILIFDFIIA